MKKLVSIILSVLMVVSIVPFSASAKDSGVEKVGSTYSGTCGENVNWSLDTSTGVLNITGSGAMTDYEYCGSVIPWYNYEDNIKTVSIEKNVTSIGAYAFAFFKNLTSVTIPDSVTSIGKDAFFYCTSLTSITIPNRVTSIGKEAFYYCTELTNITIPSSVTSIGGEAFAICKSLTNITVESNNKYYTSLNGNLYNKDKTELIQYAIGKTDTSFTIPSSVKSIENGAFKNCTSLKSITIPSSVTSISDYAFEYCTSVTSVTIPDSVTSIGKEAFFYCTSLTNITVNSNNANYSSLNGNLYNKDKTELIQYAIGKTDTSFTIPNSVTNIGGRALQCCTSLTSVTIPSSVTIIGENAFANCTSLTSVTIPSSMTSIGKSVFWYCTSLTSVTIPSSVTSIESWAFYNCTSLTDVYYTGTESQWDNITIKSDNIPLTNATKHYLGIVEATTTATTVVPTTTQEPTKATTEAIVTEPTEITEATTEPTTVAPTTTQEPTEATTIAPTTVEPTEATTVAPTKADQKITGVKKSYSDSCGKKIQLNPIVKNSAGNKVKTTLTYKSSNTKVATVSKAGKVTIKGMGTAKITIKAKGNSYYNSATKKVTIKSKFGKIKITGVKKIMNMKIDGKPGIKIKISWKKPKGTKYVNYTLCLPSGKTYPQYYSKENSRKMDVKNNKKYCVFKITAIAKNGTKSTKAVKFKANKKITSIKYI